MKHKVFFEIYGKRLYVNIEAKDKEDAMNKVRSAIKFHKIEPEPLGMSLDDIFDAFNKIFTKL